MEREEEEEEEEEEGEEEEEEERHSWRPWRRRRWSGARERRVRPTRARVRESARGRGRRRGAAWLCSQPERLTPMLLQQRLSGRARSKARWERSERGREREAWRACAVTYAAL